MGLYTVPPRINLTKTAVKPRFDRGVTAVILIKIRPRLNLGERYFDRRPNRTDQQASYTIVIAFVNIRAFPFNVRMCLIKY